MCLERENWILNDNGYFIVYAYIYRSSKEYEAFKNNKYQTMSFVFEKRSEYFMVYTGIHVFMLYSLTL